MAHSMWSTSDVEGRQRFSYWRDAVCQTILHVDAEPQSRDNFEACISGGQIGGARIASFVSKPHRIVRNRGHVIRSAETGYLVSWQREGRSRIEQHDSSMFLEPGEIGIVDVEKSFHIDFPTSVNRTLALVPRRSLEEKAPWFRRSPPLKVTTKDVFARLICEHLTHLSADSSRNPNAADLLIENVCNLLALATASAGLDRHVAEFPTEALLFFCRENLYRPELSPPMAASQLRISVRTIHLRFQRMGTTFGAWVLSERLEACRRALENAMLARQSISEIAFDHGFREISHFSRVFKSRFGMSPRDYRAAKRPQTGL